MQTCCTKSVGARSRLSDLSSPEGLTLHVLICQAVIGESLIPRWVAGVSQGLCAQLVRLLEGGRVDQGQGNGNILRRVTTIQDHTPVVCVVLSQIVIYTLLLPNKSRFGKRPHFPLHNTA